jgi:hypothetical protein
MSALAMSGAVIVVFLVWVFWASGRELWRWRPQEKRIFNLNLIRRKNNVYFF